MDISIYFDPIAKLSEEYEPKRFKRRIGDIIKSYYEEGHFPVLENIQLAIVGVPEDRNSYNNKGCAEGVDVIRSNFYSLFEGHFNLCIADLGNIRIGSSVNDTYVAISNVCSELIQNNIIPMIIGGSQDITFANYLAYEKLGQIINIFSLDSRFDIGDGSEEVHSESYLSKIIMHQPNFLFNYTNVGYQSYFVSRDTVQLMDKLLFDIHRLGSVRDDIEETEPMVRNADMLSFDVSSIRISDAPGCAKASPNGFYGEEACQIIRYAGLSDKLTSIGFYEYNPAYDVQQQTAMLIAQMMWYFIEGFYNRKKDFPHKQKEEYVKYHVTIRNLEDKITFYKSKKSDRWWIEVPVKTDQALKYERHYLVPCSYNDYKIACDGELPDRWWQTYKKMM